MMTDLFGTVVFLILYTLYSIDCIVSQYINQWTNIQMLSRNTRDRVGAFYEVLHDAFFWYIHTFIETFEGAVKFLKFLCLHYDDGVVSRVVTLKKVMFCVTLFTKLQNEWDKQRQKAKVNYLRIQKRISRNKHEKKKIDELNEIQMALRQSQIAYESDKDFDILYNACIVFALGYLSVPLLQVILVLFFPFWVMVFIFITPPILIAFFIITFTISVVDSVTGL